MSGIATSARLLGEAADKAADAGDIEGFHHFTVRAINAATVPQRDREQRFREILALVQDASDDDNWTHVYLHMVEAMTHARILSGNPLIRE